MERFRNLLWRTSTEPAYIPIQKFDLEESETTEDETQFKTLGHWKGKLVLATIGVAVLILLLITLVWDATHSSTSPSELENVTNDVPSELNEAVNPASIPIRQEWRTLSPVQQQDYIKAVKCLTTLPSVLEPQSNLTRYTDFPYVHAHIGYRTHNSAPFLPWHRYFLHIYESTLRDQCGFTGSLTYWDWTLDSSNLHLSPVFSPATGFGGDGDPNGANTVGRSGRCVIDGPFAGIEATWYDVKYQPHCLSRGFRDDVGNLGTMDGSAVSKESIAEVLSLSNYEEFVKEMESRVHDAIPFGIGGDFETFTAPFDPLFYLHHTQLDRLWWLWQQRDPAVRLTEYSGHGARHSVETAKLTDRLDMGRLAPQIEVGSVMDTEGQGKQGGGMLNSRYS